MFWEWAYLILFTALRRRQWHPTPVLLPGKPHGRRSLVGCSPWDLWESDMTERLHFHFSLSWIGEGNGDPLQCSCLENPRDRGAWWSLGWHRVGHDWSDLAAAVSQTVNNLPARQETWIWSLGWEDTLEKGMATDSSILTWRIPWREESGGLQSVGLQRVGQSEWLYYPQINNWMRDDASNLLCFYNFTMKN